MQHPPAPSHVRRRGRPSAASARSVPRRPLAPGAALPLRSQPQRERLLAWSDARIVAGRGGYSAPGSSRHLTVPGRPRFGRTRRSACLSMRCRRRPPARSLPRRRPAHRSACPSVSSVATKRGAPVGPAARRTACRSCLIAVDFGTRMLTSSTRRLRAPASSSRAAGVISTPSTRWVQYRYWRPQPASPMRNSDTHEFWPDQKTHEFWPNGQDSCGCTLPSSTCCHTFRATGITAYLSNGGTLEHAQQIAGHASPKTTKLYDRTSDTVTVDEIERIVI